MRVVINRSAAIPSFRTTHDPYEARADALGDAITQLVRQAVADVREAVEAALATVPPAEVAPDTRLTLSAKEAGARLGLSLTTIRRLIGEGDLPTVWVGGRCLVPVTALEEFVARLKGAQGSAPAAPPQPSPPQPSHASSGRRLARSSQPP